MNYGLPYMGSKNSIARWVVEHIPSADTFIDLFAGGCAVTHAALLSGRFGRIIANDISDAPQLFRDAVEGKFTDERRWISRDDFHRLKDSDPYVRYCWSFGNAGQHYLYSKEVEPWKRAVHYARVLGDCSILESFGFDSDGSIADIPSADYMAAERRAIQDMQATKKPFLTIINTRSPGGEAAATVKEYLSREFGVDSIIADCQSMDESGICALLQQLLYAFPMVELHVHLPRWMDALEPEHPVKAALYQALMTYAADIPTLAQAESTLSQLRDLEQVLDFSIRNIDLATGTVSCALSFPETLFYEILSSRAGMPIANDAQLLKLLTELSRIKGEYEQVSDALAAVQATGYGVVMPTARQMQLEKYAVIHFGR